MKTNLMGKMKAAKIKEEAKKSNLDSEKLLSLSKEVNKQLEIENEIKKVENYLKELKEKLVSQSQIAIPDLMQELGLHTIKTKDGFIVNIKSNLSVTIAQKNKQEAFSWLRKNGYDDIIKSTIVTIFGKGEDEERNKLAEKLYEENYNFEQKETVHPQTLKSFVKECREKGVNVPPVFSVYDFKITEIKKK